MTAWSIFKLFTRRSAILSANKGVMFAFSNRDYKGKQTVRRTGHPPIYPQPADRILIGAHSIVAALARGVIIFHSYEKSPLRSSYQAIAAG